MLDNKNFNAKDIIRTLDKTAGTLRCADADTTMWTTSIKSALCNLGKEKNFYVCASHVNPPAHNGEWLYDVCWVNYIVEPKTSPNDASRQFGSLSLIVESEWNHKLSDILDDFEKLLIGRSSLKLMIFENETANGVTEIENRLHKVIQGYAKSWLMTENDEYLLSGYSLDKHQFHHALATPAKLEHQL